MRLLNWGARAAESGLELREMYVALLQDLLIAPRVESVRDRNSIGSSWGTKPRDFRERIGLTFEIDTDEVVLSSSSRPLSVDFAMASSAWILAGRNDLEALSEINPRGTQFSLDGYTLSGAFGHRLRQKHGDQLEAAVAVLRNDPTSRRAVALIGEAADLTAISRDFPCATSIQFIVREGLLCAVLQMRSQSMFGVFPYDLVNFRHVHRYVAWRLGIEVGSLVVACTSAHIYDEEVDRIEAFLESDFSFVHAEGLDWPSFIFPSGTV